jgi:hypothetical protein
MKKLLLILLTLLPICAIAQSLTYRLDVKVNPPVNSPWSESNTLWLQHKIMDRVMLSMVGKGDIDADQNVDDGSVDVILKFTVIPLYRGGTLEAYCFMQITLSEMQNRIIALESGMKPRELPELRKMNLNGADLGHTVATCNVDNLESFVDETMQILQNQDLLFARRELKMVQSHLHSE